MEKKEKSSPPGPNMFDPATLLGASPFSPGMAAAALPFAHLAHLPGAFSMLGHPAFPVSSLFGHLGDGLSNSLGIPASLASSLSPTSAPSPSLSFDSLLSPILLSMGQGGPISDPFSLIAPNASKTENSMFGMFSMSSASPTTTTTTTSQSSSSAKTTPSSATATASCSSRSSGGTRSSANHNSSGQSSTGRGGRRSGGRGGRSRKQAKHPAIPLSLVQATSILSPSMLEKYAKQHLESSANGFDGDAAPDRKSISSLFDVNFDHFKDTGKSSRKSSSAKLQSSSSSSLSSPRSSPTKTTNSNHSNSDIAMTMQDKVHIDSLKKKLLADQIRHRMQSKLSLPEMFAETSSSSSTRKRRGRPPKISQDDECLSPQELEEQARIQEQIRRELELQLKQKEIALKLITGLDKDGHRGNKGKGKGRRSNKSPTKLAEGNGKSLNGRPSDDDGGGIEDYQLDKEESDLEFNEALAKVKDITQDTSSNVSSAVESNDLGSGSSEADAYTEDSENDTGDDAGTSSGKRKSESTDDGRPVKRRHVVLDDGKIRFPLEKGWKRQTNIHSYGRRGIVGEVWYFAPCGRKMKTIPDVMRYIERNNVDDLGRGHFSFNTKVNVGDFYEARVSGGENGFAKLSETEIGDRLSVTVSRRLKKIENQKKRDKLKMQQTMARQMIENKMKHKIEQQEMARKVAEMQFQKRIQREQQKEMLKRAKQIKILEKRKHREMERQQREEQLRLKQEMRAQQLMEKRRQKQADRQKKKYIKALKKAEERELKRQQVAMLKEQMRMRQEQERRRQHMILLKALEQRKKQEEREKQKEEKIAERRLHRERKEEQRKMEFVLAQELKKPREDMELRDQRDLPEVGRIAGNYLDGEALADCLMSLEFLHNFAKPLGFDGESLPTLKSLEDAVSCKTEEDGEEYLSLVTHLLRYALDDPGVASPKEAVTKLGQKITDLELTDVILAEVLRIFMIARNGGETQLSEYLRTYPLEACSLNQRAGIIAFLCNELNCSKMIITEIEGRLDNMADIRRDKWVVEGKLRRLRSLCSKKFKRSMKASLGGEGEGREGDAGEDSVITSVSKHSDDEEDKEESGQEDESFNEADEEDDPTSLEECEKHIEKLQRQHAQYRDKVFKESQHVRAIDLGQDRYKRNYWVLPHVGGVFLEGMESGEIKDVMLAKTRSERSGSDSMKIELIAEKTEKKGVEFLEEEPEKKAADILKLKEEDDVKEAVLDTDKKFLDGKQVNGLSVKCEKDGVKKEGAVDGENSHVEVNGKVEEGGVTGKEDEELNKGDNKDGIKCETSAEGKVLCNGDISVHDGVHNLDTDKTTSSGNTSHSGNEESVKSPTKHVELKIPNIKASAIDDEQTRSVLLQVPQSTKLTDFCSMSIDAALKSEPTEAHVDNHTSSVVTTAATLTSSLFSNTSFKDHVTKSTNNHHSSLTSPLCPPPAHSKTAILDRKSSFMSIDSILDKSSSSSPSSHYFPNTSLPVNPFVSQSGQSVTESPLIDSGPWFSLLPRVPCDDMSLTRGQHSSGMLLSPPFMSQLPFHPFSLQTPAFTAFQQMGQMYNTAISMANTSAATSAAMTATYSDSDMSFKKPAEPATSSQNNTVDLLKSLQGEAKPIPQEYTKGWWKISDPDELNEVTKCLHTRGIRERSLQKTIQKFEEFSIASCSKQKDVVLCMESSSEEEVTDDEADEAVMDAVDDKPDIQDTNNKSTESNTSSAEPTDKDARSDANDSSDTADENHVGGEPEDDQNKQDQNQDSPDKNPETLDNNCNDEVESGCESKTVKCDNNESDNKEPNGNKEPEDAAYQNGNEEGEKSDDNDDEKDKQIEGASEENTEAYSKTRSSKTAAKKDQTMQETESPKVVVKKYKKVKKPPPTIDCKVRTDEADRLILEEVETFEDRISTASLQVKGWKLAPKTYSDESDINIIARGEKKKDENDCNPVEAAKERLLQLELNIERRYLKPPLSKAHRISLNSMSSNAQQQQQESLDDCDSDVDFENLPIGLQMWRIAVATATSPAQLMLCIVQLNKCISWEKSIMKVLCQICRKDDNEAELLLCDGCDRGYHTYCFKPKMETVPEGDWYCFECVAKVRSKQEVAGETCCLVCGRRLGKMAECHQCNRCVHIDCLEPPLQRVPRKWFCTSCDDNTKGHAKKRPRKNSTASTTSIPSVSNGTSAASTPVPSQDLTPTGRKRRSDYGVPRKRKSSDTSTADGDSPQKKKGSGSPRDSESPDQSNHEELPESNISSKQEDNAINEEKFKLEEKSSDLKICRTILTEMMKHEDGWPFLQPVNCKHFPSYRKYIKAPMDFGTMKIKLRDHIYQLRSEFVADAIMTFDNCQLFNEDDSEVGQCGHNMRQFFTRRWKEVIFEAMTETNT